MQNMHRNLEDVIINYDRNLRPFVNDMKKSVSSHNSPCKKKCGSPIRRDYGSIIMRGDSMSNNMNKDTMMMTTDFNLTATTER